MLLRFRTANHLSIWQAQELSFVASALKDTPEHLLSHGNQKILPTIGLYGANASGKSNVVDALAFFVDQIVSSQTGRNAGDAIPRKPFLLAAEAAAAPSDFDCDVVLDGVRYHYGFSVDGQQVLEEWLYAWPGSRRQVWFHRDVSAETPFHFGGSLRGHNKTISDFVRPDSLFLSAAAQHNHEQLSVVYRYFKKRVSIDTEISGRVNRSRFESDVVSEQYRQRMINFILSADVGISSIRTQKHENHMLETANDIRNMRVPDDADQKSVRALSAIVNMLDVIDEFKVDMPDEIQLGHHSSEGTTYFNFNNESTGTRVLLSLIGPISYTLDSGGLLIIDEIDSSMHPVLAAKLIALFTSVATNPNGGQLLFTTHDTNLLKGLRRDQVWFTEKNQDGATTLYPLTDFRTRRGDDLARGYLQGRFGAIPVLGSFKEALIDEPGS